MSVSEHEMESLDSRFISRHLLSTEYLSLVAHDLGHQAISILSSAETLERKLRLAFGGHPLFRHVEPLLQQVLASSKELHDTIQNVRNFRIDYDRKQAIEFDVGDNVRGSFQLFESALSQMRIRHEINEDETITTVGDPDIFKHVISNLIINSIDAQKTRRNLRPNTIRVDLSRTKDEFLIKYQDEGPGINQQAWPNLGEIFHLGSTSKQGGTGLGLPIVRKLLHQFYAGEIALLDPKTALFQLRCPLRRPEKT